MFKQCIALFLLVAMMASTFSKAVIVMDFYANQDLIAKTLCVNKNKPMMHCQGKCQLCKRLAHEENQDKNTPDRKSETGNEVFFFEDMSYLIVAVLPVRLNANHAVLADESPVDRSLPFFHPPGC